jgi:hypothetical protein
MMRSFREHFILEAKQNNSEVMAFIRANPPTAGHEKLVNHVGELANNLGASHRVILSKTYDGIKNPLPPEVKLMHAKRAFPGMNVVSATPEQPTLLHHAADAYRRGIQHLHVVAGQDRVNEFQDLLNRYNGVEGAHKIYKFKTITVHSAGDRDPDAEGVEGISGSLQRSKAAMGDRLGFHAGAPSLMTTGEKDDLYQDTNKYTGSVMPKGKKKLKEDFDITVSGIHPQTFMPASVGDVRGLGLVSGDPAITSPDELEAYWDRNMDGADASNDQLGKLRQAFHDSIHINNTMEMDDVLAQVDITRKAKIRDTWHKAKPRGL